MKDNDWNISRTGHAWHGKEVEQRYNLTPEKMELIDGRLFWSEEERVNMIGLLLENLGVDRVVRLGNPSVWKEAIRDLK